MLNSMINPDLSGKKTKLVFGFMLIMLLALSTGLMAQNNCLDFDGTDDYVSIDDDNSLDLSSMTIEFWIYLNSSSGMEVLSKSVADNDENFRIYIDQSNSSEIYFDYGNKYCQTHSLAITTSAWYHMAFSVTAGSVGTIYVNGIEASSYSTRETAETVIPTNNHAMEIGGSTFANRYLNGKMDEVRIWNDIRTEDEIRQNMYRELPTPSGEANLVAYYKLNSTSGTTATDSKGSNDGTLTNMSGNEWQTSPAMFGPKNALDFDGSDDYVSISNLYVSGSAFTVETWVYFDSFNGAADYNITNLFRGGGENIVLRIGDDGMDNNMPQFVVTVSGQQKLNANARLSMGTWYHIAGVYDGSELKLYINGKLDKSQSQSGTLTTTTEEFRLGGDNGSRLLDGLMEEVRIWSDARTASEIRENMCKNLTGNEDDLFAYYSCDNTSGTTLQDFSGNEFDGSMNNMDNSDWVASSAFNTWLNTSSSDWSTTTNWSHGSLPGSTSNIGIYSYSGGTNATLSGSPTVHDMVLGSSSTLTLSSGITVNGNLILENDVDLNGQTVTLGSSAYLIENSGHFSGNTGSITTTRDLSNIDEDVAGLGAEITTSADMGYTIISRTHTADTDPVTIKRRFTITPTTNTGLNATLVFHYYPGELNGLDESTLYLLKSIDGGSNWTNEGGTVDNNANTITKVGIGSFSDWTAGGDASPILETSNPSQNYFSGTTAITIASATTVTYSGSITAATVSISTVVEGDVLSVSGLPGGLSSSWDNDTKILTITGTGTATNYRDALRLVKFESTSTTSGTRTIDFNLGDGIGLTLDGQKHFYEVIGDGVSSITWTNARAAALARTYSGASGYLATIMSEEENSYLKDKVTQDTWLGGSDVAAEDVWKWMDGPEAGIQFWSGGSGGHTVNGNYCHWYTGEPNNAGNEDYLHMRGSDLPAQWGYWNDYVNNNAGAKYYITEYGGDGTIFTTMDDATIEVKTDLTWDGSAGTDWNTAANWNYDVVPTLYCNITIPDVANAPTIASGSSGDCNNITINSGATLTLESGGSLITAGSITNNGTFNAERSISDGQWHL
ncbi:MAG: LamG-like jellyroll fold domain-containing protein, partial [Bacteroidota bacterium]|nr:LamG-like jellyroll fold domain-containing protein [Bacteroidota bacterium]